MNYEAEIRKHIYLVLCAQNNSLLQRAAVIAKRMNLLLGEDVAESTHGFVTAHWLRHYCEFDIGEFPSSWDGAFCAASGNWDLVYLRAGLADGMRVRMPRLDGVKKLADRSRLPIPGSPHKYRSTRRWQRLRGIKRSGGPGPTNCERRRA